VDVAEALLDETGVAVMPGEVFGCSSYFRVSSALEAGLLTEQGCSTLVDLLN